MRGLFAWLALEYPHSQITKIRVVCNSFVGQLDWDIDVIVLTVFPLSLTDDVSFWFNDLPYKSIFTWEQLAEVFFAKFF